MVSKSSPRNGKTDYRVFHCVELNKMGAKECNLERIISERENKEHTVLNTVHLKSFDIEQQIITFKE